MSKHTAGRWKIDDEQPAMEKGAVLFRILSDEGKWIADLCEASDRPDLRARGWTPVAEAEANARLIAASPALLAACKAFLAKLEGTNAVLLDREGDTAKQIRAAIAAAEQGG
jgi:hypothetical protein